MICTKIIKYALVLLLLIVVYYIYMGFCLACSVVLPLTLTEWKGQALNPKK